MRHLCCARCARILIADFWTLVALETVPTFSGISLTCRCGNRIKVDLAEEARLQSAAHSPWRVATA